MAGLSAGPRREREVWRKSIPKSKRPRRTVSLPPWLAEQMAGSLAEHPYGTPNPNHRPEASLWPSRVVGGNRLLG